MYSLGYLVALAITQSEYPNQIQILINPKSNIFLLDGLLGDHMFYMCSECLWYIIWYLRKYFVPLLLACVLYIQCLIYM
jgi:hypothetical protein